MSTTKHHKPAGIKETLTSLIIAFMLAFLFRGFVIEGFVIPTGSMAPTLMGKHMQITSPVNGYKWAVGPWDSVSRGGPPLRIQGVKRPIRVNDPMSGQAISKTKVKLSTGDRVFVLKYLPVLHSPDRWDVVVFKFPGSHINYIKRLVGLPGEQLVIVDGDVFTRPFTEGTAKSGWDTWEEDSWQIARKPERVQRTMFLPVFDSKYAPLVEDPSFRSPWVGDSGASWSGLHTTAYTYSGSGSTVLSWSSSRPITDHSPYNQVNPAFKLFANPEEELSDANAPRPFPVSDIAMALNIKPTDEPVTVMPTINARGMQMRAVIDPVSGSASVQIRSDELENDKWEVLDSSSVQLAGDRYTHIEFWHVDQSLWLYVDGALVCGGPQAGAYTLTPAQRAQAATGIPYADLQEDTSVGDGVHNAGVFSRPEIYRQPTVRWAFEGGGFTLNAVRLDRDISYQINPYSGLGTKPTRGGHPDFFPTLTPDEYFMCGDNSPRSHDSRFWTSEEINPWVRSEINANPGVVHRDLIVGKAFVVYFPAMLSDGPIPTPDVGKIRWIW